MEGVTVSFYDLKNRVCVEVPSAQVLPRLYVRHTAQGNTQMRYALRGHIGERYLTKFVPKDEFEALPGANLVSDLAQGLHSNGNTIPRPGELLEVISALNQHADLRLPEEKDHEALLLTPSVIQVLNGINTGRLTLDQVDPYVFEHLIAELQHRLGYEEIEVTKRSGDGGVDIYSILRDPTGRRLRFVTECKKYRSGRKVGPELVRALYGVVESQKVNGGLLVTSSFFTSGARRFEQDHDPRLALHDSQAIYQWIADTSQKF